jgi:hypothetical protein
MVTDPERQFHSSYIGMGNNPLSSFDPSGGLIIFINGFHAAGLLPGGSKYWGGFGRDVSNLFGESYSKSLFADGDEGILSGMRRYAGRLWAAQNLETIKAAVAETHQLIVVSHSMGGVFGDGVIEYLKEQGIVTDLHVAYAPFQDWAIGNVGSTQTLHFTNNSDWVSGSSSMINGINTDWFKGQGNHFINTFRWSFNAINDWYHPKATIEVGELMTGKVLQQWHKDNNIPEE